MNILCNTTFWLKIEKLKKYGESNGYPNITMEVAHILSKILIQLNPKNILEIGTCNGLSTIVLAYFTTASITTIEQNKDLYNEIKNNLKDYIDRINIVNDNAIDYLKQLYSEEFDFVFIDATKKQYVDYLHILINNKLLSYDCCIVLDNVIRLKDKMQNLYIYLDKHKISYNIIHTDNDGVMVIKKPYNM